MKNIEPKPPELIQKIEWLRLYGLPHWKPILIALAFVISGALWKYYDSTKNNETKNNSASIEKSDKTAPSIKEEKQIDALSAPKINFVDGTIATVEFSVQAQLDPNLLIQAHRLFGSEKAAAESLRMSLMGALIATLELKTQEHVRKNRDAVAAEIIERTKEAQKRTAYQIIELKIGEIY